MLQCDNISKAMFVHEIKNPMAIIQAHLDLISLDKNLDIYKNNINIMKGEINKMSSILDDVAIFCRPISKSQIIDINIFDMVQNITNKLSQIYKINFCSKCLCDTHDAVIKGEYSKIDILFNNIYKNSIEAIEHLDGFVQTVISKDNGVISVNISDNGKGMDKDISLDVYTPFVTNKEKGNGLGVPICKKIVEDIGGQFSLYNNAFVGCTASMKFSTYYDDACYVN